ncbi:MAG: hypothetical protein M9933_13290 [Chitinophagaceae bacterium]|nr:hypothetical protein [Chitinophagaceae bacterium]
MKKHFFILLAVMICGSTVLGQVSEAVVDFNKTKRTVKSMEINDEPDVVEQAVKNKMLEWGYKPKEKKGWMEFNDVNVQSITDERSDFYVKVERKSKRDKNTSVVYFFASKPGDQVTPVALQGNMLAGDGFYNDITNLTTVERLERDIKSQEDVVKKTQKKYDDLVKDQASLEKKIKGLESDLEENKKKQESQLRELDDQRRILDQLNSKRN